MKLAQYVLQRFVTYLAVLFIGITITFFLPRLMPGDPINNYISQVQSRAGQTLTPEATQQLRDSLAQLYGLQGDLFTQYLGFLNRVFLHFDFGPSFTSYPEPVSTILLGADPGAGRVRLEHPEHEGAGRGHQRGAVRSVRAVERDARLDADDRLCLP